jgi:hypothetical protein
MWFSSWLTNRNSSQAGTRCCTPSVRRKRSTFRPRLEALEVRFVPSTLTVTNNLDDARTAGSLRYEIAVAQSGDTILFDRSLKGQTIVLNGNELLINKNLTIQGLGAGNLAISGNNASRVFEVTAGAQVTLSGMTIENGDGQASNSGGILWGSAWGNGGGILNQGTLTLSGDTLTGNAVPYLGGGIANELGGTVTINGSTIKNNSDDSRGGGAGVYNDGTMTISGSSVTGNTDYVTGAGGIFNDQSGNLTLSNSVVTGNTPFDLYNLGIWKHQQTKIGTIES